jgi:hypothetical protein
VCKASLRGAKKDLSRCASRVRGCVLMWHQEAPDTSRRVKGLVVCRELVKQARNPSEWAIKGSNRGKEKQTSLNESCLASHRIQSIRNQTIGEWEELIISCSPFFFFFYELISRGEAIALFSSGQRCSLSRFQRFLTEDHQSCKQDHFRTSAL